MLDRRNRCSMGDTFTSAGYFDVMKAFVGSTVFVYNIYYVSIGTDEQPSSFLLRWP